MKYVPLPLRPLRGVEKGETTIPSFDPKGKKMFASEKVRKQNILPPRPPIIPKVFTTPINVSCFSCVRKRESGNTLRGKYKKMDPVDPLRSIPFFRHFLKTLIRLLINSPSQNEIVGRFPGRVHSRVVRLFPVWTPNQTLTFAIDLCGVNGLVAFH